MRQASFRFLAGRKIVVMNLADLEHQLYEEGCTGFSIQGRGTGSEFICLVFTDEYWTVFYTERGCDSPPIFRSRCESEACEFFLHHMKMQQNWHCVGFFESEEDAISLELQLRALSVEPIRNDIPVFTSNGDPCFRVFVVGKQIHVVRNHFESLPLRAMPFKK